MLENAQRRATKLVKDISSLDYDDRLIALGLPTLSYRRTRNDMIQVYKIMNGIDRLDKELFFREPSVVNTRGHSFKVYKGEHVRCKSRLNSFSHRVINPWNKLTETVVCSKDVNQFKSNLNNQWKNHPQKFSYNRIVATRGPNYPKAWRS